MMDDLVDEIVADLAIEDTRFWESNVSNVVAAVVARLRGPPTGMTDDMIRYALDLGDE